MLLPAYSHDFLTGAFPAWIASSTRSESVPTATYFDASGNLQTAAVNAARFGYDFFSGKPLGYISEKTATNSLYNSTMAGASAGTPGTLPNHWSVVSNSNGLSTSVATGTTRNVNYIDFRVFGTSAGAGATQLYFDQTNYIAGAASQFWSSSAYLAIVGGSNANLSNISLDLDPRNSSNVALGNLTSGSGNIYSGIAPGTLMRFYGSLGATPASTAFVSPLLSITPSGTGVAIDITIRITMPMLSRASGASWIATTNGPVTRSADVAQFNATLQTLLASKVFSIVAITSDASSSNSALINGGGNIGLGYISPGQVGTFALVNTVQRTGNLKIAMLSSASVRAFTNNGGALYDGSVVSDASPVSLGPYFAGDSGGTYAFGGSVATMDVYDKTLTQAQLQALSKPLYATTSWGDSITAGTGSFSPDTNYGFLGYLNNVLGAKSAIFRKGYPGQGAVYIKNQMVADTKHRDDTTIFEVGRNDAGGAADVVGSVQAMAATLTHTRFVVLAIINTPDENSAASGAALTRYNWIKSTNAALLAAFPNNFLDVRTGAVSNFSGANDAPPSSVFYNNSVHGNDALYLYMAQQIAAFGVSKSWPGY